MIQSVGEFRLRRPEPEDRDALYRFRNDPEIVGLLGGFSSGYSKRDIEEWIELHRREQREIIWAIAREADDRCVGHVGLYQIDHRVRSAEFAILIGDRDCWGKGLGRAITKAAVAYGFSGLNLNRIHLTVLSTNQRARALYGSLGFVEEGCMRQAQYRNGAHVDVVVMGILRGEFETLEA